MKKLAVVLFAALLLVAWGPGVPAQAAGKVVRVTLIDENGSGEDGAAQLTDQGDGTTKVGLIMLNAPDGAVQPADIHKGTCTNLGPTAVYSLENVVEAKSTSIVKVALDELLAEHYAINVYKSAADMDLNISCGNLPLASTGSGPVSLDQAFATLIDQATELAGTITKQETDASLNAYDLYHATFAANEAAIQAKSAGTQAALEDAMNAVHEAITAGDWAEAGDTAAQLLTRSTRARRRCSARATRRARAAATPPAWPPS